MLRQKSADEKQIHEIRVANNPYLREKVLSRQASKSAVSGSKQYSASYLTDSDDEDFNVPEERDWRREIQVIKKRTGDFNVNNYTHILTEEERTAFQKIIRKIEPDQRVYIQ